MPLLINNETLQNYLKAISRTQQRLQPVTVVDEFLEAYDRQENIELLEEDKNSCKTIHLNHRFRV